MTPREISKERNTLITNLKRIVRPHLRTSSYRDRGTSRPLQIWAARNKNGEFSLRSYVLQGGFVVHGFQGFTSQGVVVEIQSGALVILDYAQIPLEDLHRLNRWAERKFSELEETTINEVRSRSAAEQDVVNFARYEGLFAAGNRIPVDNESVQTRTR